MFEHFTDKSVQVIVLAQEESRALRQQFVDSEQVLLGIISEETSTAASILKALGADLDRTRNEVQKLVGYGTDPLGNNIPFTPRAKAALIEALAQAKRFDHQYISPEHLLLGLIQEKESQAVKVLSNLGVELPVLQKRLSTVLAETVPVSAGRAAKGKTQQLPQKAIAQYGTDLTAIAATERITSVVGRNSEIERVAQILGRRSKNNPVLIGEPGVGKTAIAEGLAQRIVLGDVPSLLAKKRVISLDLVSLVAGSSFRGEFEERLKQVTQEVQASGDIILFIDEIHTLVGAGSMEGGMGAANLLKPALARGELQCLGATTVDEYRKYIEQDPALERRFQPVTVNAPTVEETIEILQGIRQDYEAHHNLKIEDSALVAAAQLSDRYLSERNLPDKAIDLIDEAGSRVRLRHYRSAQSLNTQADTLVKPAVNAEDVAQVLSAWSGVPVQQLSETEKDKLINLEAELHQRVIGQKQAVKAIARSLRRTGAGLKNLNRPIGSFIFCGPTGVGKTELAKAIASSIFGSEEAMVRLDMSEYMESQSTAKLIGSPPGYVGYGEGGQLTEAVRRHPYSVVLFDEIEKAHPDTFNLLLQLLDDGHLSDSQGSVVDFKNTLIIMTSNLGARAIEKGGKSLGFEPTDPSENTFQYQGINEKVNDALKQSFRPEFLNRLDEIIVFQQLNQSEISQIAELLLSQLSKRLETRKISVEVTPTFKERLIAEGYDPSYGARPMRRAVTRLVEDPLAEALLSGKIQDGDTVLFDLTEAGAIEVKTSSLSRVLVRA